MSVKTLLTSFSAAGSTYWGLVVDVIDTTGSLAIDASSNIYYVNYASTTGYNYILKVSSLGVVIWKKITSSSAYSNYLHLASDSSGNNIYSVSVGGAEFSTFSNTGTVSANINYGYGTALDFVTVNQTNGNIVISANSEPTSSAGQFIKLNSSKTFLLGRGLPTAYAVLAQQIDSSDNIYLYVYDNAGFTQLLKISTTGTITWQRRITLDPNYSPYNGGFYSRVWVDSSSNVYTSVMSYNAGTSVIGLYIVKYNSSGVVQWQRFAENKNCMAVDSSGNVYLGGFDGTNGFGVLTKLTTAAAVSWERSVKCTNATVYFRDIIINTDNTLIAAGDFNNNGTGNDTGILKIATDGSIIGTYGDWSIGTGISTTINTTTFATSTTAITLTTLSAPTATTSAYTTSNSEITTTTTALG